MLRLLPQTTRLRSVSRVPRVRARLSVGLLAVALTAGAADAATSQPRIRVPNLNGLRATAPSGLLSGPDVSSNNHGGKQSIKWGQVSGGGRAFTIVKATGEHGYTNPWFKRDWQGAGQAGLVRAAYHFAIPSRKSGDAVRQAKNFVRIVSSAGGLNNAGTLPLVLDLEQTGGLRPAALQTWVRGFLTTVEKLTHRPPMIYTYTDFWRHQMGNAKNFTHYPLWIASYTAHPPSPLPGGWPAWTLWQYTSNGRLPGVRGPVDLSVFCCSAQTLTSLSDGRPLPVLQRWISSGGLNGPLGAPIGPLVSYPAGPTPLTAALVSPLPLAPASSATPSAGPPPSATATGPDTPTATPTVSASATSSAAPTVSASATSSAAPTSSLVAPFPGGSSEDFVGGSIYSGPAGTFIVKGLARSRYVALGGPTGPLGFPTADTTSVIGGRESLFAGGALTDSPVRGTHELTGQTLRDWLGYGGAASVYGLPSSDTYPTVTGTRTDFGTYSISEI